MKTQRYMMIQLYPCQWCAREVARVVDHQFAFVCLGIPPDDQQPTIVFTHRIGFGHEYRLGRGHVPVTFQCLVLGFA